MTVTASDVDALLDRVPTELLIGGEWVGTSRALPVENPATEEILVEIQCSLEQLLGACVVLFLPGDLTEVVEETGIQHVSRLADLLGDRDRLPAP